MNIKLISVPFSFFQSDHQSHYEQFGRVVGRAVVDGIEYPLDMNTMRDHTVAAKRDWRLMHRYGLQIKPLVKMYKMMESCTMSYDILRNHSGMPSIFLPLRTATEAQLEWCVSHQTFLTCNLVSSTPHPISCLLSKR